LFVSIVSIVGRSALSEYGNWILVIEYRILKVPIINDQYRITNKEAIRLSPFGGTGRGALRDNGCRPLWILKSGIL